MSDIVIKSTSEFVKEIEEILKSEKDKNIEFLFRGQPSVNFKLLPSIARNENLLTNEKRKK